MEEGCGGLVVHGMRTADMVRGLNDQTFLDETNSGQLTVGCLSTNVFLRNNLPPFGGTYPPWPVQGCFVH